MTAAQFTNVTVKVALERMKSMLGHLVPDFELEEKARLVVEINRLKKDRNAVILGHNYMEPALYHTVADFVGDSLELCKLAKQSQAEVIVFCGVEFMAETAKILNPTRKVLIPSKKAGCSLAQSIKAEDVRELKRRYPGVPVVTYINTYADVKAETDVCCTSSNASHIVKSLNCDTIIFIPDEYLARNVAKETGRTVIFPGEEREGAITDKLFISWRGKCEVHEQFRVDDIERVRTAFPDAVVLAHPECSPEVTAASDFSGSTSAMIKFVREIKAPRYLLLTECAMGDNIAAENPDRELLRLCSYRCPHMHQITLEDTLASLENLEYEVFVPEDIRVRALRSIERMLEFGLPNADSSSRLKN